MTVQNDYPATAPNPAPALIAPTLPHIFYGADYNPEQWPEEIWAEDTRLMQEAGVNMVSLGIFSWAKLEPRPGEYDFSWLDRVMDLLARHNIKADLATATASPPPWMAKLHPESLPVKADGTILWHGSRQQYCPSSPDYRQAATALVRQLATRYANHPALAMWHINNEYGCHVAQCFCDTSATHFRQWLKNRYGSLEQLNEAWATGFWSQQYSDWDEIIPPRQTPTFINPSQKLDFARFSSDALLECFEMEKAILKEITPKVPVTTNFMSFFKPLDYWKWASREDVVSNDAYPDPSVPGSRIEAAMGGDLMRSLGGGKPWMMMEQVTGQVNWRAQNVLKRPGQMRLWSYQAVARGANGIMFFQWRQSKGGAEKFHSALVPHVGTGDSRIWREVVQLGGELRQLDRLLATKVKSEVAIVFDWESWWALEMAARPSSDVKMMEQLRTYYEPLYRRNIGIDFVQPSADLSGYKVVLVPNLYMVRDGDGLVPRLEKFVADGGTLVMSFFSGIVDENDHVGLGGYPAAFRKVLGLRVEEFDPYVPGQTNNIRLTESGTSHPCDLWSDVIDLEGAEALGVYSEDFYAGKPALTRHKFGQGNSYYLGTRPDTGLLENLLADVCSVAGVTALPGVPEGVEVVARQDESGRYLFVLNHNNNAVEIELPYEAVNLLGQSEPGNHFTLGAYDVLLLTTQS